MAYFIYIPCLILLLQTSVSCFDKMIQCLPPPFSHFSLFTKCQFRCFYTALFDHRYRSRGKFGCFSAFIKYRKTEITVIILLNNIKNSLHHTPTSKNQGKSSLLSFQKMKRICFEKAPETTRKQVKTNKRKHQSTRLIA